MTTDNIKQLAHDAQKLIDKLSIASTQSPEWYARNNLMGFVKVIKENPNAEGVGRATFAMSRFITDQYDWSDEYCKQISNLMERARQIQKELK